MIPDVNVLVAAFRTDHSHHATADAWLSKARSDCARGIETLTLLPIVITSFLRLVTNPRVFTKPDPVTDAVAFIDAMLQSPGVDFMAPRGEQWPLFRNKLLTLRLSGNLVTDAWIASAIEAHSEHLVTFDRDFRRLLAARDFTLLSATK